MKKVFGTVVCWIGLHMGVQAQFAGFPLADTAKPNVKGSIEVSAGGGFVSDGNVVGTRIDYSVAESLSIFADLGLADPKPGDNALSLQAGLLYVLPVNLMFDMALRTTIYKVFDSKTPAGDLDILGFNVGIVSSGSMEGIAPGLEGYTSIGLDYRDPDLSGSIVSLDSETEVALHVGLLYQVSESLSFYGELGYIGDAGIGLGVKWRF